MGVLIYTHDATPYRVGEYVEGDGVVCSPAVENLTVIVRDSRPKHDVYAGWLPYIAHRMVVECTKMPNKVDDERVIFDKPKRKDDFMPAIKACMTWRDRKRAWVIGKGLPYPLLAAFLRENDRNIEMWRTAALGFQWVPMEMQVAALIYGAKPVNRPNYPKKSKEDEEVIPHGFRESDVYANILAQEDNSVGNHIRRIAPKTMPKKSKKRQQRETTWL
jgi:hypothetical protein